MPFVFTRLLTTGLSVDRSVGGRVCYVERKMACYDAGAVCKGLSWSHHGGGCAGRVRSFNLRLAHQTRHGLFNI